MALKSLPTLPMRSLRLPASEKALKADLFRDASALAILTTFQAGFIGSVRVSASVTKDGYVFTCNSGLGFGVVCTFACMPALLFRAKLVQKRQSFSLSKLLSFQISEFSKVWGQTVNTTSVSQVGSGLVIHKLANRWSGACPLTCA